MKTKLLATCIAVIAVFSLPAISSAHTPVTTKYDFGLHVRPILKKHCDSCHGSKPLAPMSLVVYRDVRPWAASIKDELLARTMPPVFSEPGVTSTRHGGLSARELDTVIDWISGGTPRPKRKVRPRSSSPEKAAPRRALHFDLEEISLEPDEKERVIEAAWIPDPNAALSIEDWRVDTWGENLARSAIVRMESEDDAMIIGTWISGRRSLIYPPGTAVIVAPGARIVLRLRYVKPWTLEGEAARSRLRLTIVPAETPPRREAFSMEFVESGVALPAGARLLGVMPRGDSRRPLAIEGRDDAGQRLTYLEIFRSQEAWPLIYEWTPPLPAPQSLSYKTKNTGQPAPLLFFSVPVER